MRTAANARMLATMQCSGWGAGRCWHGAHMHDAQLAIAIACYGALLLHCLMPTPLPPSAGLLVFADWYHLDTIHKLRFFDDNTRSWWDAATGGQGTWLWRVFCVPMAAAAADCTGAGDWGVMCAGSMQAIGAVPTCH